VSYNETVKTSAEAPPPFDSWAAAVEEANESRLNGLVGPAEHFRAFRAVCELATAILRRHPDRDAFLAYEDAISADSRTILERLRGAL
jgi:hypothetical protein